jgi:hypothetical protein
VSSVTQACILFDHIFCTTIGIAKQDDFGVGGDFRLVVSEAVLDVLRSRKPRDLTFKPTE